MYSICGTSFTVLKIIAWSFFGKDEFAIISANVLYELGCGLGGMSLSGFSIVYKGAGGCCYLFGYGGL